MPWLQPDDEFDPDRMGQPVIGIAAGFGRHDSGWHQHGMGQLLFTQSGCISISLPNRLCMLPPTRAAWIPPGIPHRARMTEAVDYRSLYLDVSSFENLPDEVEVMEVTPLLRAVLERIATAEIGIDWEDGAGANLLAVCLDEIQISCRQPMLLPLPSDRRLAAFNTDELPPPLGVLARRQGTSEKTIGRIFRRETGMNYQQWRQQWRLLKAVELLAGGAEHHLGGLRSRVRQRQRLHRLFQGDDRIHATAVYGFRSHAAMTQQPFSFVCR